MSERLGLNHLSEKKLIFLLVLIVFLVYTSCFVNEFVWDDIDQIIGNRAIQNLSNLPLLFKSSTSAELTGRFYRPLMSVFFAVSWWFGGKRPLSFHLLQLALHCFNVILVFLVLKKLFKKGRIKTGEHLTFGMALIYGVHPVNVESVAYISAVNEVLYAFFWLMSFWLILQKKDWAFWLSPLPFFLGLLSKESAIVGGGLILFYLILFEKKRFIKWLGLFTGVFIFYLWLYLGVARVPLTFQGIMPIMEASLKERLLTIPWEFFSYLRLIFWPQVLAIAQHFVVKEPTFRHFWLPLGIDLLFLGSLLAWGLKNGSKLYWFFAVWFLAPLGLVMNIIPLTYTITERWLYFPLIGFLGILSLMIAEISRRKRWSARLLIFFFVAATIALSFRTVVRNFDWRTPFSLYHHDVQYSRYAFDIENNLGAEYYKRDELDKAQEHFKRSIKLQPRAWRNYSNLAVVWEVKGDLNRAEGFYRQAIENGRGYLDYGDLVIYENLFFILLKQKKYGEAEGILERAIFKYPESERLRELNETYWRKKRGTK